MACVTVTHMIKGNIKPNNLRPGPKKTDVWLRKAFYCMRVEMSQRQPKSVNEDNVRVRERLYGWWWERSKDDECSVQLDFISPWLLTWLVVLWRYPLGPHVAGNSCVDRFPDSGLWRHTRLFALNTPPPPKNFKSAISLEFTKRVNIQKWVMFWAKLIQSQSV